VGCGGAGAIDLVAASLVLAAAVLVQVATNMQNDVGYTVRRGESSGTRTGLPRATANGWLSVREVRVGIVLVSIVAFGLGLARTRDRRSIIDGRSGLYGWTKTDCLYTVR
jgi:1,4-dihydroxy-2-naphthoate octaprenyltransferase